MPQFSFEGFSHVNNAPINQEAIYFDGSDENYLKYMECFYSRDHQPYRITEKREVFCIKKEFNSRRISLLYHHGRHFFVLELQHGRLDIM